MITVTGVDEHTDLKQLKKLARPGVEIGILVTSMSEGRARYPSEPTISLATHVLAGRCALHICGRAARINLMRNVYDDWVERARRIQINGHVSGVELMAICERFPDREIITQHCPANKDLLDVPVDQKNHSVLVDASGGRGLSPADWQAPLTSRPVGFAGGLGPDNLKSELKRIHKVSKPGWWVDMEGKLRDAQDRFDLKLVARSIDLVLGRA